LGLRTEKGHKAGRDETEGEGKGGPSVNMAPEDFCVEDFQVKMMQTPQKNMKKNTMENNKGEKCCFSLLIWLLVLGFLQFLVDR